jgi:hypothetical protein
LYIYIGGTESKKPEFREKFKICFIERESLVKLNLFALPIVLREEIERNLDGFLLSTFALVQGFLTERDSAFLWHLLPTARVRVQVSVTRVLTS